MRINKLIYIFFISSFFEAKADKVANSGIVACEGKENIVDGGKLSDIKASQTLQKRIERFNRKLVNAAESIKKTMEAQAQEIDAKEKSGIDCSQEKATLSEQYSVFMQKINVLKSKTENAIRAAQMDLQKQVNDAIKVYCKSHGIKKLVVKNLYLYIDSSECSDHSNKIVDYINSKKISVNIIFPEIDL